MLEALRLPRVLAAHPVLALFLLLLSFVLVNAFVAWASARRAARVARLLAQLQALPGSARTPVTLVTGFLGAGKTTLLNGLLRRPPPGVRLAVLENERGAIPLDHELLAAAAAGGSGSGSDSAAGLRILLLANGCMCCSSGAEAAGRGDLERSLEALLALGGAPQQPPPGSAPPQLPPPVDHIVIEASGLADPAPLVHALLALGACASARFYLAGVVAVCDAAHLAYHADAAGLLSRATEAGQQLAFADLVLMNKADAAGAGALAGALAAAARINPTARLLPCTQCAVDPALVLDCRALDPGRALAALGGGWAVAAGAPPPRARHAPGVVTIALGGLPSAGPRLPREGALLPWLQALAHAHSAQLYRIKGLVACAEDSGRVVLFIQGVHASLQVARVPMASLRGGRAGAGGSAQGSGRARRGSSGSGGGGAELQLGLVLIGLGLPQREIEASFAREVWQPEEL